MTAEQELGEKNPKSVCKASAVLKKTTLMHIHTIAQQPNSTTILISNTQRDPGHIMDDLLANKTY